MLNFNFCKYVERLIYLISREGIWVTGLLETTLGM